MRIPESEIVAELIEGGARVEDHFLIGDSIYAVNNRGLLCALLVDDLPGEEEGEMHDSIVEYLRRNGAKIYESEDDYREQNGDQER